MCAAAESAPRGKLCRSRGGSPGKSLVARAFRSIRDPGPCFIHSSWEDDAAFDLQATPPHTTCCLERMDALTDQPRHVTRTELLA
jgi:quinol monooxygenase YgiN